MIITLSWPDLTINGAYGRKHMRGAPLNMTGVNGSAVTMGTVTHIQVLITPFLTSFYSLAHYGR